MAARIIKFHPGGYYHIFNRGANKQKLFLCPSNYAFIIRKMNQFIRFGVGVIAYCLMPNHYHFLLRQENEYPVNQFIQSIFNSYSKAFNVMYNRKGTLFEGPFKAVGILEENYLIHLCRYIHRNPLEAGLVEKLTDWPYSNYPEWINKRTGNLVDQDFIAEYFPSGSEYERFVLDYRSPKQLQKDFDKYIMD
jgi:REP element-mobilizing transposase RayT